MHHPLRNGALIAAVSLFALTGCSSPGTSADGESLTTVRFGIPTQMGANNAPMAVADALGYFEEEGIRLEIVHTTDTTAIIQGISSGNLEIGSTPPEPLLQAIENGGDVAFVYNYIRQQTGSIAALAKGPIRSLEDLEGGAIGQSALGSSNLLLSNGILSSVGLEEDVDFTNVAVGTGAAALQALETGQVDALSLWDTEYAAFEQTGAELTYFTTPEVESLFSTTYFTSPDYVSSEPDVVEGFGRAMAKATLFTATNPEAALRIMYEAYPNTLLAGATEDEQLAIDIVALSRRIELLLAGDPQANGTWGAYSPEAIRAWEDFALEAGIVDSEVDAASHVVNDFVDGYSDFDADAVITEAQNWSAE
ncbi:exported protein [Microbacterium barkeri]|uniref:Thiamine pyrimidine synthase n=1 Tax=Microbacterium barkeri TaxID=33917 RepID=A0A9W6H4M0_9MICO|nr:ABC transporter substrate-binding protein [Microbacterium barkeri]MDI6944446.1 ABC transporter substrate-binding protein [Microbacterium barkeri]MDR6877523.1 NitT/TauT family transport system substrate-binding protein [Microbacterium barkeri]GLJ62460.1 exported protein [Microbacterium barkeri]